MDQEIANHFFLGRRWFEGASRRWGLGRGGVRIFFDVLIDGNFDFNEQYSGTERRAISDVFQGLRTVRTPTLRGLRGSGIFDFNDPKSGSFTTSAG